MIAKHLTAMEINQASIPIRLNGDWLYRLRQAECLNS